jgi:hypothetical protein
LGAQSVHFTTLESLVGKLEALTLAAPGILIKLRRCYKALAGATRSPSEVLRVEGPLRDELRELASMPFWRAAVAPWVRPVHLTVVVPERVVRSSAVHGRGAQDEVLVSYGFPGVEPGSFRVAVPTLFTGGETDAARSALIGDTVLFVVKEAVHRTGAASCFVTLGLHTTWRPATVFGSDLSLSICADVRANELF